MPVVALSSPPCASARFALFETPTTIRRLSPDQRPKNRPHPEETRLARLTSIEPGFYRIPLPVVLTDSTHGEIRAFELNTMRLRDADGAEGVGYTFTVGRNGAAIDAILRREMPEIFAGAEADHVEALWQKAWWALH